MTTRIGHLNTKCADEPTDPAQLIARGVKESIGIGDFKAKENVF